MIMTADEFRTYHQTDENDTVLENKLLAIEMMIRKYTNNNFQNRNKRFETGIKNGKFTREYPYIKEGDTIQITESELNNGLCLFYDCGMNLLDEEHCLVTKVEYPADIKMGASNMLAWDLENRDKVGIQSETISRHSVTYFNMDGNNSIIGYPKSLIGFLKPYKKARF